MHVGDCNILWQNELDNNERWNCDVDMLKRQKTFSRFADDTKNSMWNSHSKQTICKDSCHLYTSIHIREEKKRIEEKFI